MFQRKYVKPESQATAKHKWHRLIFDPKTMKLPDFLQELNQGAKKSLWWNYTEHDWQPFVCKATSQIETICQHGPSGEWKIWRELEPNALEEFDDLPMTTMALASTSNRSLLSNSIDTNKDAFLEKLSQTEEEEEEERKGGKNGKKHRVKHDRHVKLVGRRITLQKDVGKALGGHLLRPKGTRPGGKANDASRDWGTSKKPNNAETSTSGQ